jgi:hypothetical protein
MALNPFIGWNQQDLEAELRRAQEDLAAGKTITQNRSGDVGKVEQVEASALTRIRQLLIALNKLDPTTYPADQISPVNRTKVTFDRPTYYGY